MLTFEDPRYIKYKLKSPVFKDGALMDRIDLVEDTVSNGWKVSF